LWFPDMDRMVEQMKQDAARAREILSRQVWPESTSRPSTCPRPTSR
jgi:hypothetical protein